jgi:hypothetical protein
MYPRTRGWRSHYRRTARSSRSLLLPTLTTTFRFHVRGHTMILTTTTTLGSLAALAFVGRPRRGLTFQFFGSRPIDRALNGTLSSHVLTGTNLALKIHKLIKLNTRNFQRTCSVNAIVCPIYPTVRERHPPILGHDLSRPSARPSCRRPKWSTPPRDLLPR